ncbi:Hypothetical predicted protein [Paramuricea clavata]|uniref:Uncharacterized protein n=1 Tax=Paramuricea clavata TaxID=317549 RepID=A0A6S7ILC7_PARCT|nr:Hypothetical predicted protein [Paramuricea clavata]
MASSSNVLFQPTLASSSSVPFQLTMASSSSVSSLPTMASSSVPFRPVITSASVPLRAAMTSASVLFHPGVSSTNVPFRPEMASSASAFAERQAANFQIAAGAQPRYPVRPRPSPGVFMFGRLPFLHSRVSRCYGCGGKWQDASVNSSSAFRAQYWLVCIYTGEIDGETCITPSLTYFRWSLVVRTRSCGGEDDLIPFLLQEHYD